MRLPKNGITGMVVLAAAGWAGAHLVDGSLHLSPAAPYTAGQLVTLTWEVSVLHDGKTNIDFSKDAGTSWTSIKSGFQAQQGSNTYKATIPNEETSHGIIRVCLGAGSPCGSVKISQPSTAPYTLVSNELTISGTSAILPASKQAYALGFEPVSGKFVANFDLAGDEKVLLQAFDFQGRLQATLLQGAYGAGQHKIAISLPQALAASPALMVRLTLGDAIHTQAFTRP